MVWRYRVMKVCYSDLLLGELNLLWHQLCLTGYIIVFVPRLHFLGAAPSQWLSRQGTQIKAHSCKTQDSSRKWLWLMGSPPIWLNLSGNYTGVQDSSYPILLSCSSPSQVPELHWALKALLAFCVSFTGVSPQDISSTSHCIPASVPQKTWANTGGEINLYCSVP